MLQQVPRLTYEVAQGKRIFQEHRSCSAVVKCTSFPWQEPCWGSVCPCPPCQPWSCAPSPRGVSTVPGPWEGRWCPGTPWHCPAEPVVLRGWGWNGSRAAGAACPVCCSVPRAMLGKSGFAHSPLSVPAQCSPFFLTPCAPLCLLDLGAFPGLCQGSSCWVPPLPPAATTALVAQSTKLVLPSRVPPHLRVPLWMI